MLKQHNLRFLLRLELLHLLFQCLYFLRHFDNFRDALPAAATDAQRLGAADGGMHVTGLSSQRRDVLAYA